MVPSVSGPVFWLSIQFRSEVIAQVKRDEFARRHRNIEPGIMVVVVMVGRYGAIRVGSGVLAFNPIQSARDRQPFFRRVAAAELVVLQIARLDAGKKKPARTLAPP